MMQQNLLVHVHGSPVQHAALQFSMREMSRKRERKKERKRVTSGWNNISGPGPASFLYRSSMY